MCDFNGRPARDQQYANFGATQGAICNLDTDLIVIPPLAGNGSQISPLELDPCAAAGEFFVWDGAQHICGNIVGDAPITANWDGSSWRIGEDSCTVYKVPTVYNTIQAAIDAINSNPPSPGNLILLCPGAYIESFTVPRNTYIYSVAPLDRSSVAIRGSITYPNGSARCGLAGLQISSLSTAQPTITCGGLSLFIQYCNISIITGNTVPTISATGTNLKFNDAGLTTNTNLPAVDCDSGSIISYNSTFAGADGPVVHLRNNAQWISSVDLITSGSLLMDDASLAVLESTRFTNDYSTGPTIQNNSTFVTSPGNLICQGCTFADNTTPVVGSTVFDLTQAGTLTRVSLCTFMDNTTANIKTGAATLEYGGLVNLGGGGTTIAAPATNVGFVP